MTTEMQWVTATAVAVAVVAFAVWGACRQMRDADARFQALVGPVIGICDLCRLRPAPDGPHCPGCSLVIGKVQGECPPECDGRVHLKPIAEEVADAVARGRC